MPVRLARLEIENFELIARATLEFADGFTVCTGETGSGKTMLLGALSFVLGERSSADVVRGGAARAHFPDRYEPAVRGRTHDDALRARLAEMGLDDDGETAIILREMQAGGKSTARVNGTLVTASQLRDLGDALLEQIGQHEHQRLLSRAYQLDALDAFAGDDALAHRAAVTAAFERVGTLEAALRALQDDAGRALAELEFARFAAAEIDEVAPIAGEDEGLRERRDYLANVEKIGAALGRAHDALAGGEASAAEALGAACESLREIARYSPDISALAASLAALQSDASDAALAVARELDRAEFDPRELEAASARLDRVERLKKKYGGTIASVHAARERFADAIVHEATRRPRESGGQTLGAARRRRARARRAGGCRA